jgi:hypothetical protein
MMNLLIIAVILLSVSQTERDDKLSAIVFCIPIAVFAVFGDPISGWFYYSSAGVCAGVLVKIFSKYFNNGLSLTLSKVVKYSIIINLFGFNMWFWELSPDLYHYLFILYYFCVAYILLSKGSSMWIIYWRGSLRFADSLRSSFGLMKR